MVLESGNDTSQVQNPPFDWIRQVEDNVCKSEEDHIVGRLRVTGDLSFVINHSDRKSFKEVINLFICEANRSIIIHVTESEELADSVLDTHKSSLIDDEVSGVLSLFRLRPWHIMF